MNRNMLEICCGDLQSVAAAIAGGADRVELCSGLAEGGLTPSAGFIRTAADMAAGKIRVHVLIRPRGGDFCYDETDRTAILADIAECRQMGPDRVAGVVVGALTPDGDVDLDFCRACVAEAGGMSLTFHRAFDLCRDRHLALEQIAGLGFDRILTSGGAPSALAGADTLRELVGLAAGRIIILGASGVSSSNAAELLGRSALTELHASARSPLRSAMRFRHEGVAMGAPDTDEYLRMVTDAAEVAGLRAVIDGCARSDV